MLTFLCVFYVLSLALSYLLNARTETEQALKSFCFEIYMHAAIFIIHMQEATVHVLVLIVFCFPIIELS